MIGTLNCISLMQPLPVLTDCQPMEKAVLACTMYMVTGLWLSGPDPQDSFTVVSVMSVTSRPSGPPGGPAAARQTRRRRVSIGTTRHNSGRQTTPSHFRCGPHWSQNRWVMKRVRVDGAVIGSIGSPALISTPSGGVRWELRSHRLFCLRRPTFNYLNHTMIRL